MQMQETGLASVEVGLGMSVGWDQQSQEEKGEVNIRRWISSPARTVSVTSTRSQVSTEAVAQSTTVTRVKRGKGIAREKEEEEEDEH